MPIKTPPPPTRSKSDVKPCWITRWRGGLDPETGKRPRYIKRFWVASEREAMTAYAQWLAELELEPESLDPRSRPETLCVADLCEQYLRYAERTFVKDGDITSHVHRVKTALQRWIELPLRSDDDRRRTPSAEDTGVVAIGDLPAGDVRPPDLARYRDALVSWGGRIRSRATINDYVGVVRAMYRWAVERGMANASVWHGLQAVESLKWGRSKAKESKRVTAVGRETVEQTLPHLSLTLRAMVEVLWHTPMRVEEAVTMRVDELDTGGDVWLYRPTSWKTQHKDADRKERTIPIGPKAQEVLRPLLERAGDGFVFRPSDGAGAEQQHHGECYTTASVRRAIHRACDAAWPLPARLAPRQVQASGRKRFRKETPQAWRHRLSDHEWGEVEVWRRQHRWNPNQLRHAKLTRLERQYGLDTARKIAGHGHSTTTLTYVDPDLQLAIASAREAG